MSLIIIDNAKSVCENASLLESFAKGIYEPSFPDRNEREEFDEILRRTALPYGDCSPKSIILLSVLDDLVVGGEVIDLYSNCQAIQIIYLAMREGFRKKGLARQIVIEGTQQFLSLLNKQQGIRIECVYFETNNPFKTPISNDNFDMIERLEVFSRLGAKWIDINYMQPALSKERQKVDNLYLMAMPSLGVAQENISALSLKSFLEEFYAGLGVDSLHPDLLNMLNDVDKITDTSGYIELKEVPNYEAESNVYRFGDAVVTIHYETSITPSDSKLKLDYCPYFNSYETDLMNYGYQKNRPIQTFFGCRVNGVELHYPYVYAYSSEGKRHLVQSNAERRVVLTDVVVNYSLDNRTGTIVAHLTITPSEGEWFAEHDIIKLTALYGSIQEQYTTYAPLMFREKDGELESFEGFLNRRLVKSDYKLFGTGITRIDLSACSDIESGLKGVDGKQIFSIFNTKTTAEFDEQSEYFSSVLCGIILGIFDYERMTDEEIHDTIRPIVCRDKSFVSICRGNLVKIECNAERELLDHIVVSPYMLVPSVVLMFNEMKLKQGYGIATKALNRNSFGTRQLSKIIDSLKKTLYTDYLTDIFQYRSEIEIVEVGNEQRGLHRSFKHLEQCVDMLTGQLNYRKSSRANFIDSVQSALLLCLTLTQIKGVFFAILPEESPDLWFFGGLCVIFVFGVLVGRFRQ